MSYNIHQMIKNEYEKKRKKALDELEAKKSDLYYHIPRLEEIENEITQAGLKHNKAILLGTVPAHDAADELSSAIDRLRSERAGILSAHGYTEDHFTPAFSCRKCFDTGIVNSPDGQGDTLCTCYRQLLIDYLYDQSNLCIANKGGFTCFNTDYYPDVVNEKKYGIKKSPRRQICGILENCRHFVDSFHSNDVKNLLFSGPTGVGKTYMAGCIAMELMKSGHTVLYQTAPSLFNAIYEYRYNSNNHDSWDSTVYKNILETELLIIDDLGTESPTAMRYSELLNIIDTRMSNNTKKSCKTIIATNIDLKKLFEYYDERIVSRITGGFDIFRFAGDDIRSLKKIQQKTD